MPASKRSTRPSPRPAADERAAARRRTASAVECIRRLVSSLGESARAVEQQTGATNAQVFLLRQLEAEGELSINEIAARALTQQSTASILVRRLEEAGLVRRRRQKEDSRRVHVSLTSRGRALVLRAPDPPMARMLTALSALPARDVEAIITGLGALLRAMRVPSKAEPLFEARRAP
jgi:DNA-binding MarR family transcriptional regulator